MKKIKISDLQKKIKSISLSNVDTTRYGDGFEYAMSLVNKAINELIKQKQ